jgi:hypothetical protein
MRDDALETPPAAGAETVLPVDALAADERRFLTLFRLWLSGQPGQAEAWRSLTQTLPPAEARALLGAFDAWLGAMAESARRRLTRRCPGCPQLGRDEALLTGMVSAAGRGDPETAEALAREVARPALAPALVCHARALGLALRRAEAIEARAGRTLH